MYSEDGIMMLQCWWRDGQIHREGDGPAEIRYRNGIIESECRYRDRRLHREGDGDGPAQIWYYESGTIMSRHWYRDGLYHRKGDRPAQVDYSESDTMMSQSYYRHGRRHREGGLTGLYKRFL